MEESIVCYSKEIVGKNFKFLIEILPENREFCIKSINDSVVVEAFFKLLESCKEQAIYILLVNSFLLTLFGKKIISEARENKIVISTKREKEHLERIILHEIGHVLGLSHHLNCIMSPYYENSIRYCIKCKRYLIKYLKIK